MGWAYMRIFKQIVAWSLLCSIAAGALIVLMATDFSSDCISIKPWKLFMCILISYVASTLYLYKDSRF